METKNNNIFYKLFMILFVMFLCLYAISNSGYMSKIYKDKTLYTEEQINKFENDVASGKEVNLEDYLMEEKIDYSNKFSRAGEKISNAIDKSSEKLINSLKKVFLLLFQ